MLLADMDFCVAGMDFLFGRYGLSVWPKILLYGRKRLFLAEITLADTGFGRIGIDYILQLLDIVIKKDMVQQKLKELNCNKS